mmetsp:Transcript_7163/g.14532  ORF Transcript_7163/g.14532 Transcript_7163/m.14532 type:complete len:363 (-) Transcript_7163:1954-3042(-)
MRDEQGALLRPVVVQLVHDLHRHVRLARAGRAHHHRQPRVHPGPNRAHLGGREVDGVDAWVVLGVGPRVRVGHRLHLQHLRLRLCLLRGLRLRLLALLAALLAGNGLLRGRGGGGEGDLEGRLGSLRAGAHVLYRELGERLLQVVLAEEGVLEGDGGELVRHVGVVRRRRVAVPEEDVVQPLRDGALLVHQVADALQDRLEVVLLGLAAHEEVEGLVDVLAAVLDGGGGVQLVLRRVQRHRHRPHAPLGGGPVLLPHLASEVVHQLARLVADLHHLAPAHVLEALLLLVGVEVLVLVAELQGGGRHERHEEEHVVLLELVPLEARLPGQRAHVHHHVRQHLGGLLLADLRVAHLGDGEGGGG